MYIPIQACYHGHLDTFPLPSWCREVLLYGRWAGSYCHTNTLVLTPYARDSKIGVQHEKENKDFSCLRDKEITPAVVRGQSWGCSAKCSWRQGKPQWFLVVPADREPRHSYCRQQCPSPRPGSCLCPLSLLWSGMCSEVQSKGRAC